MLKPGLAELNRLSNEYLRKRYPSAPDFALPSTKYNPATANGLTKCIIDFINLSGYQAERISSQGRQIDQRKVVEDVLGFKKTIGSVKWIRSTSTNGTADISATIKGRSIKIEVKIGADKMSKDQLQYKARVEAAGGLYFIAKDFESFYEWVTPIMREGVKNG